jgi:hypothetical protein
VALTKGHIREAIRELRRTHYERSRESKKWDVLDPETGRHLPPKLVLHRAYELAGTPRYPGGGWPTNNVLEAHGFTVVPKTQAALEEAEEQLEKLDDQALRAAALRGQKKVPPKVHMTVETVARSPAVSAYVKRVARGRCDRAKSQLHSEPAAARTLSVITFNRSRRAGQTRSKTLSHSVRTAIVKCIVSTGLRTGRRWRLV